MNEQTTKLISELAAKLGTTAEHLWGVLIRQAPISSITTASILVLMVMLSGGLAALGARLGKEGNNVETQEMGCMTVIAAIFLVIITLLIGCIESERIIAGFFNPEYWALKQILK